MSLSLPPQCSSGGIRCHHHRRQRRRQHDDDNNDKVCRSSGCCNSSNCRSSCVARGHRRCAATAAPIAMVAIEDNVACTPVIASANAIVDIVNADEWTATNAPSNNNISGMVSVPISRPDRAPPWCSSAKLSPETNSALTTLFVSRQTATHNQRN